MDSAFRSFQFPSFHEAEVPISCELSPLTSAFGLAKMVNFRREF